MMNKPEFDAVIGSAYVTVNELFSRGVRSLQHTSTSNVVIGFVL
jgi:hypothetical protein